ncbi:fmhA protein [Staphylococcus muscae]|uniref:FmhA protein n=1 Tax=Staphylococcus muscae TaxID=1294 RepID=A0A240BWJ4_9STAP|nr:hypothetical protein GCM10007183_05540 [Staphylococcus muscae]SNW00221.1 fmhA protein [Staphylococcus muscae]
MEFGRLNQHEFETFVKDNFLHYTQSHEHFSFRSVNQKDVHLVGVKDEDGTVLAACLLTEARSLKFFKYFYTHRGPVMDYQDLYLVKFFYYHLTEYLKKHNCLFVLTDPYLLENLRDTKGNILKHYDNDLFIKQIAQLGFEHQGYSVGYSQTSQIRWLSVLDLADKSEDQLLKEMDYQTRRNIKKHTRWMYKFVRYLSMKQIDSLSCSEWLKKNMVSSSVIKIILRRCNVYIQEIVC